MGLFDWFTSDWETLWCGIMLEVENHGGPVSMQYFDNSKVQEHVETGERRIVTGELYGTEVRHDISKDIVPNVVQGEVKKGFGPKQPVPMYRRSYLEDTYGVQDND